MAKTWRRKSNSSPQLRPPADVTSKPRSARRNPRLKAKDEVSGRVPARVSRRPEVHLGMIEALAAFAPSPKVLEVVKGEVRHYSNYLRLKRRLTRTPP